MSRLVNLDDVDAFVGLLYQRRKTAELSYRISSFLLLADFKKAGAWNKETSNYSLILSVLRGTLSGTNLPIHIHYRLQEGFFCA